MRLNGQKNWQVIALTAVCWILFVLSGCAVVGPRSISMGRANYNEAINRTEDEQMLLAIVKERYGETSTLLAVSGIAANVRFRTNAAVELGFGPQENYAGRLKPFSGGLAYEENPTITYAPVQGEQYIRQLMSPIPLDLLLLAIRSSIHLSGDLFTLLVDRVNDLRNPDFLYGPQSEPDPRFKRFVELLTELLRDGILDLVRSPREEVEFDVVISNFKPAYPEKVSEFLALLDLPAPPGASEEIVIPANFAINTRKVWGIGITTRSTLNLIEILRAAVEVPQEHAHEGLDIKYPPMGLPGEGLRIISSKERPERVSTAVKYEGYWFYTDKTDQHTKAVFRLVRTFWSISIAGSAEQKSAPVLTIPVSR